MMAKMASMMGCLENSLEMKVSMTEMTASN
jgi:hypothetical protein